MKTRKSNEAAAQTVGQCQDSEQIAARNDSQNAAMVDSRECVTVMQHVQTLANSAPRAMQLRQQAAINAGGSASRPAFQVVADNAPQTPYVQRQTGVRPGAPVNSPAIPIAPIQGKESPNNTALPDQLKSGIEALSGMSMDHVKVHYNSDKPAQLQAHAYAQGSEIHLGAGQERHLPHEAWHVVQQAQGRVRPTLQMKAGAVNDDPSLEKEADMMGEKAAQFAPDHHPRNLGAEQSVAGQSSTAQRKPSHMQTRFGMDPLFNLPPIKMLQSSSWNSFVLHSRPYFKLADDDEYQQKSWLSGWFMTLKQLVTGDGNDYGEKKLALAQSVFSAFEAERDELFGGGEAISSHDELIASKDPEADGEYETKGNPFGLNELWARPPKMADVQQGALGDCYLLAAAASIVERSPEHFYAHMKDMLDGTVVVKLYELDGTPKNFVINKSVVGDRYAQGTLWVKLLEKAYAAACFGAPNRDRPSYAGIDGGSTDAALTHLTGKKTMTGSAIGQNRSRVTETVMGQTQEKQEVLKTQIKSLQKQIGEKKDLNEDASVEQLQHDTALDALLTLKARIYELHETLLLKFVTRDHIGKILTHITDDPELVQIVEKACAFNEEVPLLPGKLGSNLYGLDELMLYEQIKTAVTAGKILAATTKKAIHDAENREETERGHSARESMVKGLVAGHVYSVLDFKPKKLTPNTPILIKLRNPWGRYSRVYEKDEMGDLQSKAFKEGDGIFWIDIADMVSSFTNISMTVD